jgi:hypothetical protein
MSRVVASLTTIPSGLPGAIEVIRSLLKEPELDLVYLNLPFVYEKTGELYPNPLFKDPRLVINRCEDKGPITKVYPVLDLENDPSTLIFIVDDDKIPAKGIVGKFLKHQKMHPEAVLTSGGWVKGHGIVSYQPMHNNFSKTKRVDWVEGTSGIMAFRKFFSTKKDLLDYSKAGTYDSLFKRHDDHWLSWHFVNNGAYLLSIPEFFGDEEVKIKKNDNLSGNWKFFGEVHTLANFLKRKGIYTNQIGTFSPFPLGLLISIAATLLIGTFLIFKRKT